MLEHPSRRADRIEAGSQICVDGLQLLGSVYLPQLHAKVL